MKIKKIEIGNFGKFQNYSINFEDGFNIIYGNNEDGKSTLMAFIKMMFYGSTGKSVDLSKNIRKKYMPWNGAKMSGAIEFEDKDINYRVEKIFGASNATDKVSLWNKATGEKEKIASITDIGQRFFNIGAAAFEKSVFISQIGSTISGDGDKEDEITQKLLNLVSTGDESVSQKKVTDRLRSAKEALKSKSGRIGILDKLNKRLDNLYNERIEAVEDEKNKKQLEEQYLELTKEEEQLKSDYELNKAQYDIQEKLAEQEKLESSIAKKQYMDSLFAEYNSKKQQLIVGNITFDDEFVKDCEEQIAKLQTLENLYGEKAEHVKLLESESEELKSHKICEISKEYMDTVKAKQNEKRILQNSIDTLQNSIKEINEFDIKKDKGQATLKDSEKKLNNIISEKEKRQKEQEELRLKGIEAEKSAFKSKGDFDYQNNILSDVKKQKEEANTQYQLAFNNTKYVEKLSSQKIDSAREKLKQASTARKIVTNEDAGRDINKPLLTISIIILVISIILGAVINPAIYAGAVIAVILSIVSFSKRKTETTSTMAMDEAEVKRSEENLKVTEIDSEREEKAAFEAEQSAKTALKELETKAELLQKEVSKLEKEYAEANLTLSNIRQEFNELKVKLEFINEKASEAESEVACEKNELDELINCNVEAVDADIKKLQLELEEKSAACGALKEDIEKLFMDKECKTIDELQNKYIQWQSYATKLTAKEEELQKAIAAEKEAKDNLELSRKKLFQKVSEYTPVDSLESAVKAIADLKAITQEVNTMDIKIDSQTELMDKEIREKTVLELKQHIDELREDILRLSNGREPVKYDEAQLEQLKQSNEVIQDKLKKTKEQLMQLNLTIKNQFAGRKNVSEVENEIQQLKEEMLEKDNYYECLDIAETTMNEAFNEISQSFGPLLNSKTTEIFNSLTDGKYENVMISRNFDINVQNSESVTSHEWKYLSNGTIDQAYFALRLSISNLFSEEGARLPLMLDDVFLQYDEGRALQGLKFLADYSQKGRLGAQIIMFTCQRSIVELAKKSSDEIMIKSIA